MFRLARVLVGVCVALPLAAQGTNQGTNQEAKLNGPLARGIGGEIGLASTSPDGARYVYSADRKGDGVFELWSLASSGKEAPLRLAGNSRSGGGFTPDGKRVIHSIGDDRFGTGELGIVPSDGSAPSRSLTGPLPAHAIVAQGGVAADGEHFVYLVDQDIDEVFEVYSVALDGGVPFKLSAALVPGGDVQQSFFLARDGALVLYQADQDTDEVFELFVVPADGSQPARKLPIPLVPGGSVGSLAIDADGSHAIYLADQEEDERYELFRIATDGNGAPQKLSAPLVSGGDVGATIFFPTWDRSRVLYSADQDVDELIELYSVPADGSSVPVKLCSLSEQGLGLVAMSYDSRWVVLQPDPGTPGQVELFSVPTDGSAPLRRLSGTLVPGGETYRIQVSFDSQRVVYVADQDEDEVHELYSAPIDGSAPPVKLSAPMTPGGDVAFDRRHLLPGFWCMTDGVMYLADQEVDGLVELYFVPAEGDVPARKLATAPVLDPLPDYGSFTPGVAPTDFGHVLFQRDKALWSVGVEPGALPARLDQPDLGGVAGDVELFRMSADGERVVYRALEEDDRLAQLYSIPPEKPSLKVQLLPDLAANDALGAVELALDDRRVVFLARLAPSTRMQLYSLPVEGGEEPRVLGPALGDDEFVEEFWLAPGRQSVLFAAWRAGQRELHVAPADGSTPPLFLALAFNDPREPRFAPDASRVVFHQETGLYSVPLDASAPAVRVNESHRRAELDFQVTPDGSRVVHRSLAATQNSELFVSAIDGSVLPRRISDAMPAQRDLVGFALASDGSRAVYRADPFVDERFELFSVPLDGSAPAVRLHPVFPADRDVLAFAIAPDARHVVYLADARVDHQFELFSVPLDGSRPPVRISGDLAPGGTVDPGFRIAPDSRRVVYRARLAGFQGLGLFTTPIQSARGTRKLSPELAVGTVLSFAISADSSTVAFHALRAFQSAALYAAPLGGEEKATEIARRFPGTIYDYALSADGSRLVWRADRDTPNVIELYSAPYQQAPRVLRR